MNLMETPMLQGISVLMVEDEPLLRRQLAACLQRQGAAVTAMGDLASARSALDGLNFDFALLDVNLPDGLGTDLLREGAFSPNIGVVIMTAEGAIAGAIEAMKLGALDYLTKPFDPGELLLVFNRVRRGKQVARLAERRRQDEAVVEDELFFGSALAGLRLQLEKILETDRRLGSRLPPVLIEGETGTGKTTIARWLHQQGPRAEQALVEVNCPALPETLAESELFGHERGSFTDARSARMGLFEAASGGTLFLDELSSLSLPVQAKVLMAIEDGRIRRIGGNKSLPVDVRLIAASNRDLRQQVEAGQFREDLYHRLDLFRIRIPSLRERAADILPLADTLMKRICRRHRVATRPISVDGRRRLEAWSWPGNVRELAHELERSLVFEEGPLTFKHLLALEELASPARGLPADEWFNDSFRFPEGGFALESAIERIVRHALDQASGNVSAAARLLGVSRDVVRHRLGRANDSGPGDQSPRSPH
ncbi:MAG: sigma-54-dependent transcriptional regulator [Limisphaerales bacterium]